MIKWNLLALSFWMLSFACAHSNSCLNYNMCVGGSRDTEINGENPYQPYTKMLPLFIANPQISFLPNRRLISTWSETHLKPFQLFIKSAGANKLVKRPVVVLCVTSVTTVTSHACRLQYMYARRAAGRKQPPVRLPLSSASWQQPVLTGCTFCQIAFTFLIRITSHPKDVPARNIQDGCLLQAKVTVEVENVVTNFVKREDHTSAL